MVRRCCSWGLAAVRQPYPFVECQYPGARAVWRSIRGQASAIAISCVCLRTTAKSQLRILSSDALGASQDFHSRQPARRPEVVSQGWTRRIAALFLYLLYGPALLQVSLSRMPSQVSRWHRNQPLAVGKRPSLARAEAIPKSPHRDSFFPRAGWPSSARPERPTRLPGRAMLCSDSGPGEECAGLSGSFLELSGSF